METNETSFFETKLGGNLQNNERSKTKFLNCLKILEIVASNSTCAKVQIGAIIIDDDFNIIATGYNGTPSGARHCNEVYTKENHQSWHDIHAEINALAKCSSPFQNENRYLICNRRPCLSCCQAIAANKKRLNIQGVFYLEEWLDKRHGNRQKEFFDLAKIEFAKIVTF